MDANNSTWAEVIAQVEEERATMTEQEKMDKAFEAVERLGVTQADIEELKKLVSCYIAVAKAPEGYEELIGVSFKVCELFISKMKMEAVTMAKLDPESVRDPDTFAFGVLLGLCIGIELSGRRNGR